MPAAALFVLLSLSTFVTVWLCVAALLLASSWADSRSADIPIVCVFISLSRVMPIRGALAPVARRIPFFAVLVTSDRDQIRDREAARAYARSSRHVHEWPQPINPSGSQVAAELEKGGGQRNLVEQMIGELDSS